MNNASVKPGSPAQARIVDHRETIPACFERIAALHASRPAVGGGAWEPTYGELNTAANRLAHALIRRGGAREDRVALLMQHDAPIIAATFGVIKTGQVLVTLNPNDPPARLRQMLEDVEPRTIVADAANWQRALEVAAGIGVMRFEDHAAVGPAENPMLDMSVDDPAYILYTAGSTGRPNGSLHPHRSALTAAASCAELMNLGAADRMVLIASAGGGQGSNTIFTGVLTGASLWPYLAVEKGIAGLADFLTERAITVCTWSASVFRHLAMAISPDRRFPAVHSVRLASEQATREDFLAFRRHFSDRCTLNYTLASSEAGHITYMSLRRGDVVRDGRLPIGIPHDNVSLELLDEHGREVPRGEIGEIVITSPGVALQYWRNPKLTAERLLRRPENGGMRTLRTRDFARWNGDGLLEFVGRESMRVKVRGHTIDLQEIERTLRGTEGVDNATVMLFERLALEPQLVACVIPRDRSAVAGASMDSAPARSLKGTLRLVLPPHMVPSAFLLLDAFPLNTAGKLDRNQLRAMFEAARAHAPEQLNTPTEIALARIWGDVLDNPNVGRNDDFFAWGGNSLNASVVSARAEAELGVRIELRQFFDNPTLSGLASAIDRARATGGVTAPKPARAPRDKPLPPSFEQEGWWRHLRSARPGSFIATKLFRVTGPLDIGVLRECFDEMVRRHEVLRTTFAARRPFPFGSRRLVPMIRPPEPAALQVVDVPAAAAIDGVVSRLFAEAAAVLSNLERGPLMRIAVLRSDAKEHRLLIHGHHIMSDGWSSNLFFQELLELYDARRGGREWPAPDPHSLQYGDYAVWQRQAFGEGAAARKQSVAYWKEQYAPPPPPLKLPFERAERAPDAVPGDGKFWIAEASATTRELEVVAREHGATPYVIRLAAFLMLLAAETEQSDIAIGTHFFNRQRLAWQKTLGVFVNRVMLRVRCELALSLGEWLSIVRARFGEAQAHCELPQEVLADELRQLGIPWPSISTMFNTRAGESYFRGADLEFVVDNPAEEQVMPWGFFLEYQPASPSSGALCIVNFDAHQYEPAAVRTFVARYIRLLDSFAARATGSLHEIVEDVRKPRDAP